MRKKLVESDLVECVIGIGKNLFFNSPMEACIIICSKNKPSFRKNKVLFINAKDEVTRKNAQSYLDDNHIQKISSAYNNFEEKEGFSAVVSLDKIKENKSKLSISLYVRGVSNIENIPLEQLITQWVNCSNNLTSSMSELKTIVTGD